MKTKNLRDAITAKNDEFYTILSDINEEAIRYSGYFRGKKIYCNCDDPRSSNFYKYFKSKYSEFELTGLTATCHISQQFDMFSDVTPKPAIKYTYDGVKETRGELHGDGDFRSGECVELMNEADIIVTNPPFSLFREFFEMLMKYEKQFLIIGNINASCYTAISPYFREGRVWFGYKGITGFKFKNPKNETVKLNNVTWFTNIGKANHRRDLVLSCKYDPAKHPLYDNIDAIEIGRVKDIPIDYIGIMGVPVTFLAKHDPRQFDLIRVVKIATLNGLLLFNRILIKRIHQN